MLTVTRSARGLLIHAIGLLALNCAAMGAAVGPEIAINPTFGPAPSTQDNVSIAAGNNGYLAVWQDTRGTNGLDIFGCRISATGQVLDFLSMPICTRPGDQLAPAVTWDGSQYLVVWADRRNPMQHIYGCRVSAAGEVLDPQGILVSGTTGSQSSPRAAGGGGSSLVVWQDERGSSPDIYGCTVSNSGTVGKAYGISTRGDNEETPDVACNGLIYLVVWRDCRNMVSTDADIYGVRVSKLGIRSGLEMLISCTTAGTTGAAGAQMFPRVCSFLSNWMVTWQDYRNGSTNPDIYGCRVTSTGLVQDKGGIGISKVTGIQEEPGVAYDGSRILVAWRNGSDRKMRGARVTTSGTLLDTNGIGISSGAAGSSGCGVAGGNNSYVVCWSTLSATDADALFTTVSDAGIAQNQAGMVASMALNSQSDYAVTDNGAEYAVVWSQLVNGSRDIMGARISRSGVVLTQSAINLTSSISGDQTQPAIAWNGTKYLLVWRGNETFATTDWDIRGRFLDAGMNPIGTTWIVISSAVEDQSNPTVASNRNNFFVVWQDMRNAVSPTYNNDLYGVLVSSTGTVTPTSTAISLASGDQDLPKAASDGTNYMVVWEDHRGTSPTVRAARVTSTGTVQDSSGIAMPATSTNQTTPSIRYANSSYFVTWSDYSKISGCRVNSSGTLVDTKGIAINSGTKAKRASIACFDGTNYQVVWEDYRSADMANSDLYTTTVSSTGVVSSYPETPLASGLTPQYAPTVMKSGGFGALFYSDLTNYATGVRFFTLEDRMIQEVPTVAAVKQLASGTIVALSGKVVTAAFNTFYYVQESNRSSGIKVISNAGPAVGHLVDIVGTVSIVDGERQINAGQSTAMGVAGDDALKPLGIRGDWLGGGPLNAQTPGITGARGLNNIGLLVATWGNVVSTGSNYFYIQCTDAITVKVKSGSLTQPPVGKMVRIMGISTCDVVAGGVCRAIMPRQQSDIRVMN